VIATSAGGPATIINDGINGLLTMPDDAPALAANLVRVLADAHFAHGLGLAARERAQRYDWSNIGCDVLEVYRHQIRAHSNITHACASC
jgi:D-inositol-3-phosphate glycosyltransferase